MIAVLIVETFGIQISKDTQYRASHAYAPI